MIDDDDEMVLVALPSSYHAPEPPPKYTGPLLSGEEAKAAYRAAWHGWLLCTDRETRRGFEQTMDAMQPFIGSGGNDPKWHAFADSLPGFREAWGKPSIILQRMGVDNPAFLEAVDSLAAPPEES